MNNAKESKALYIVISILIAIGLWFYVVSEVSTGTKDTIRNVPITLVGQDVLEEKSLVVTSQSFGSLDLKLEGERRSLVKLTRENITVTVDVSKLTSAGEHELRCSISLPSSVSSGSVSIKNRDNRVRVIVDDLVSRPVEVQGSFTGTLANGYRAEEFVFSPAAVEVTGPAAQVEKVAYASVTLDGDGLNESFSGKLPVTLVDEEGDKITSAQLLTSVTEVYTLYPVFLWKQIPLTVELLPGGGADEGDVTCKLTPESLELFGPGSVMTGLTELTVGEIDLAEAVNNERFLFPVELPDEVRCASGETEASVVVTISGLTEKVLEVDRISLVNVPEGYEATLMTETLRLRVRGTEEALAGIAARQIRVTADLSELTTGGTYRVKVQAQLDTDEKAGILSEGNTVTVELKQMGE